MKEQGQIVLLGDLNTIVEKSSELDVMVRLGKENAMHVITG